MIRYFTTVLSIALTLLITTSQLAVAEKTDEKFTGASLSKIKKKMLDLDREYSKGDKKARPHVIKKFGRLMLEMASFPTTESRKVVSKVFSELKNKELLKAMMHSPKIALKYAVELVSYADSLGEGVEADAKRNEIFSRSEFLLSAMKWFNPRYVPLKELKATAKSRWRLETKLSEFKGNSLFERLIFAHAKLCRESDFDPVVSLSFDTVKNSQELELHLKTYFVFISNVAFRPLRNEGYKVSYYIPRKLAKSDKMVLSFMISNSVAYHCYRVDLSTPQNCLDAADAKDLKSLQAAWEMLSQKAISRISQYVISTGLVISKGETVSYVERDQVLHALGWVGESRNSNQIKKSIINAKSFADLSRWRQVFENLIDDDLMYSWRDIPEADRKKSDQYSIGKKTAERIRTLNDTLARQSEPYDPLKILRLQTKRHNSLFPILGTLPR